MDYNTEKISRIINLYLMLNSNDVSYIRNEVGRFIKDNLLPALDKKSYGSSDISNLTQELSNDCKSIADNASRMKSNSFDIIYNEISSAADNVSNYNDKPLVSQLVCLWYIISSDKNQYKEKIVGLLKERWKIKDDILADMADTSVTLTELKENCQAVSTYAPKESFFFMIRNLFRKNKMPKKMKLFEDEYKNDEQVLLNSIKELFATEAIMD